MNSNAKPFNHIVIQTNCYACFTRWRLYNCALLSAAEIIFFFCVYMLFFSFLVSLCAEIIRILSLRCIYTTTSTRPNKSQASKLKIANTSRAIPNHHCSHCEECATKQSPYYQLPVRLHRFARNDMLFRNRSAITFYSTGPK